MIEENKIEQIIKENYKASFMNNSKWEKLIENLTTEFDSIFIRYKLITRVEIKETIMYDADFKPFFMEPILYKEVEWIEIPSNVVQIQNKRVSRQVIAEAKQDIEKIESIINSIGVYEMDKDNGNLKIYGYK